MQKSTISNIYKQYQIMPNLQIHQLRVAAVAKIIVQNLKKETSKVNQNDVITACLLHDIANIIKFQLTVFPEFARPEGIEYWQKIKNNFVSKYGSNEHQASIAIAQELGVSQKVLNYIDAVSFSKAKENVATDDFGQKICAYSDMRVSPFGVVQLGERFEDLGIRYQKKYAGSEYESDRIIFEDGLREIEKQLQQVTDIDLHQITESGVNDTIETLKSWQLLTS